MIVSPLGRKDFLDIKTWAQPKELSSFFSPKNSTFYSIFNSIALLLDSSETLASVFIGSTFCVALSPPHGNSFSKNPTISDKDPKPIYIMEKVLK